MQPVETKVTLECVPEELGRVKGSLVDLVDGRNKRLPNGGADSGAL